MKVALLADERPGAGYGHKSRLRALGKALDNEGIECVMAEMGSLPEAYAIVVDDYHITNEELQTLRNTYAYVALVDDSEAGRYGAPVDMLIRPTLNVNDTVPNGPMKVWAGPRYLLLDPVYAGISLRAPYIKSPDRPVQNVLLTIGAGDPHGLMLPLMRKVRDTLPHDVALSVVIGPQFTDSQAQGIQEYPGVEPITAPTSLLEPLRKADLVICGGGVTLLEAARCGCPSIALILVENQRWQVNLARTFTHAVDAQRPGFLDLVASDLNALLQSPERRLSMSETGQLLVDGEGAWRVAKMLKETLTDKFHRESGHVCQCIRCNAELQHFTGLVGVRSSPHYNAVFLDGKNITSITCDAKPGKDGAARVYRDSAFLSWHVCRTCEKNSGHAGTCSEIVRGHVVVEGAATQ